MRIHSLLAARAAFFLSLPDEKETGYRKTGLTGYRDNLQVADLDVLVGLRGVTVATFDVALGFAVHIMSVCDVAFNCSIRAQDDPKFPRFNMCTAQSWAKDWNVILSADRADPKPVKRCVSWWTNRFRCGRTEGANKVFFGRQTRRDLVDLRSVDRSAGYCVTR